MERELNMEASDEEEEEEEADRVGLPRFPGKPEDGR